MCLRILILFTSCTTPSIYTLYYMEMDNLTLTGNHSLTSIPILTQALLSMYMQTLHYFDNFPPILYTLSISHIRCQSIDNQSINCIISHFKIHKCPKYVFVIYISLTCVITKKILSPCILYPVENYNALSQLHIQSHL